MMKGSSPHRSTPRSRACARTFSHCWSATHWHHWWKSTSLPSRSRSFATTISRCRFSVGRGANERQEEKQTMRLTDPVADMLARIRNAINARHQKVDIPASKLKIEIARILKEEGYISNYKATEEEGHKVIRVYLKYGTNNEAAISNVERVSRPGCRVYVRRTEIPRVLGGLGINILTTPRGVMTGRQARKQGLGGELLCEVW